MLGFWLLAAAMTSVAVAFVLARLLFPRGAARWADPREANLAALRASRAELDRDRAAGVLAADQVEAARAELAQRALEELEETATTAPAKPARFTALLVALALPLSAAALYAAVGNPDAVAGARAFANLSGPLTAERAPAFRDELARHLAGNPEDARAWALLGRLELALDRFPQAEAAFERAVADRKVALDPGIWCDYADAAGLAQGGRLAGKPAQLIARALAIDAAYPRALEMAGSLAIERNDFAAAAVHWRMLLSALPEGDPQRAPVTLAVERVERLALDAPAAQRQRGS